MIVFLIAGNGSDWSNQHECTSDVVAVAYHETPNVPSVPQSGHVRNGSWTNSLISAFSGRADSQCYVAAACFDATKRECTASARRCRVKHKTGRIGSVKSACPSTSQVGLFTTATRFDSAGLRIQIRARKGVSNRGRIVRNCPESRFDAPSDRFRSPVVKFAR